MKLMNENEKTCLRSPSLRQNIGCTFTMAYGNCNKASIISITKVKSTKVGLKETESNKACTRSIRKKYYEFI